MGRRLSRTDLVNIIVNDDRVTHLAGPASYREELAIAMIDAIGADEVREALENGAGYICGEGTLEEAEAVDAALRIATDNEK